MAIIFCIYIYTHVNYNLQLTTILSNSLGPVAGPLVNVAGPLGLRSTDTVGMFWKLSPLEYKKQTRRSGIHQFEKIDDLVSKFMGLFHRSLWNVFF